MNYLFDPIRKKEIVFQPEEDVRQNLLHWMIRDLGYPREFLCVEVDLRTLPHLYDIRMKLPKRRADIICYGKNIVPTFELYPLLMIECKAVNLTSKALDQVKGYNLYVNAFFIAVANSKEIKSFWYNSKDKKYESINFLPSYEQLIEAVKTI